MREADAMPTAAVDPAAAALAAHVRLRAAHYFDGAEPASVEVHALGTRTRPTSTLHRFGVRVDGRDHGVLVKACGRADGGRAGEGRPGATQPRVAPLRDARSSLRLEHDALSRIHDHVRRLGDPRFGAVRVLDWLPDAPAIVMDLRDEPSLRALWLGADARGPADLAAAFRNAGAWLRAYHALPTDAVPRTVQATRAEFTDFVRALCAFLAGRGGGERSLAAVAEAANGAARRHLPDALPTGLEHGDFAMRNVLVGHGARVTVIDTRTMYRTSIYRDVGYFLADLRCSLAPALARGAVGRAARYAECRRAFLAGYFGGAVPGVAVHLFELQLLLERWSAAAVRADAPDRPAPLRAASRLMAAISYRAVIAATLRALRDADGAAPAARAVEEAAR
jgi:hypothetical protein